MYAQEIAFTTLWGAYQVLGLNIPVIIVISINIFGEDLDAQKIISAIH